MSSLKTIYKILFLTFILGNAFAQNKTFSISKTDLKDKIKGGWAGQTIGVTFGGPMEFRYNGTIINEYQPVPWYNGYLKKQMTTNGGLYDDLYMDLTFVDVFEKHGLDASAELHAKAFANAAYPLWHANQAARYNILHGIMPPQAGQWQHNPHADCIDYQIECDFAGLMSPAMPNTASAISDKIGHIMNSGDGYYGGVFLGACYTLAFTSSNIDDIISRALKTIPKESQYYKCISDVITWHKAYPNDWKKTWFALQDKWAQDIGCPDGVFAPFNIDATLNSAYVVVGLLYGKGDFTQTMEITTRCGQDADCNPSSAGGILGTILGYSKIPDFWKQGLSDIEDLDFKYTTLSLNDVYEIGFKHALQNIERNGGSIANDKVLIKSQTPVPVKLEKSFEGIYPVDKIFVNASLKNEYEFEFDGTGFVVKGETAKWASESDYVFDVEVSLNGQTIEKVALPTSFRERRHEIAWKYQLPKSKYKVKLILKNPHENLECRMSEILIYNDSPSDLTNQNIYRFGPKQMYPKKK